MYARSALLLGALALLLFTGCDFIYPGSNADTRYGPTVAIGEGTARTYVRLDDDGAPEAVGVVLSETALQGLPSDAGHEHENMHVLRLPASAPTLGLPFDHVSLDWNPQGHEPEGLFTLPHFDVHFYMVPEAERMTWLPTNPDFAEKGMRVPEARYIPQGYVSPPGNAPVPTMGLHWFDSADPTYAPGGPTFTEVFLWGSYDGHMVFTAEPMITKAFLESLRSSGATHTETLAQPQAFEKAGYYPTRYTIRYEAAKKQYVVALEGLTHRMAG